MALIIAPSLEKYTKVVQEAVIQQWENVMKSDYHQRNNPYSRKIVEKTALYIWMPTTLYELNHNYVIKGEKGKTFRIILADPNNGNFSQHSHYYVNSTCETFTGNCGAKTAWGLTVNPHPLIPQEDMLKFGKHLLFMVEAWYRKMWATSMLVGSDMVITASTKHYGQCLTTVRTYGQDYEFGTRIHNMNYPDSPGHKICLYWKDLTKQETDYAAEYGQWKDVPASSAPSS